MVQLQEHINTQCLRILQSRFVFFEPGLGLPGIGPPEGVRTCEESSND